MHFTFINTGNELDNSSASEMNSDITFAELTAAVKSLKQNKCCGNDGLPAEFYQFFWSKFGHIYHDTLKYAKQMGVLHLAARRGVITLIPKKNKGIWFIKNLHPLMMLNTDYKILAKVLASRMKSVFPNLIAETQAGFMETRQISSTIRTTIDIATYNKKAQGYLMSLDFQKCFDRIEYSAIESSLEYLGF